MSMVQLADANQGTGAPGAAPFAGAQITLSRQAHIRLVCEAQYWKGLYRKAQECREELERRCERRLERQAHEAEERERGLRQELEGARGRIRDLEKRLFGKKSERRWAVEDGIDTECGVRPRGQQRGKPGHGRRMHPELSSRAEIIEIPTAFCSTCGLQWQEFPGTEDCEVLEIEVQAHRRSIRRKRYRPLCSCEGLAGIITAPAPARLIERGKLGISVWVEALLDKFLYGRPSERWLQDMSDQGLGISPGTLTGGLQQIAPFFKPLYGALLQHLREDRHWHADETRWEVFVQIEGKSGHRWYLWVFESRSVTYYVLDPSRSATVPSATLAGVQGGVISCDRHGAYKKFARQHPGMALSFCWAHQRRDFLNLANDHASLEGWAMVWVERIGELFDTYERRREAAPGSTAYRAQDRQLQGSLRRLARQRRAALRDPQLAAPAVKVLHSMRRHWRGLIEFAKHSEVPPDNNAAERALRPAVVGRKNYYGSGSQWSGQLAAMMFSILMTMRSWQINPRTWLGAYLQACAEAGNTTPADLRPYLPWSMDERQRAAMRRAPSERLGAAAAVGIDTS